MDYGLDHESVNLMMHIPHSEGITHLVWLQTAFLGDLVLTTGAFDLAKKSMPKIKQFLITNAVGVAALKNHPSLDKVFLLDKKRLKSFGEVKKAIFAEGGLGAGSVLLVPHKSLRSALFANFLGLAYITYRQASLSFLATKKIERIAVFHEAVRIALMLEPLGISREAILNVKPSLAKLAPTDDKALIKTRNKLQIGVAPGSVWGTKKWPWQKFLEVVCHFCVLGHEVVLLGSKAESSEAAQIMACVPKEFSKQVTDKVGKTDLLGLFAAISELDLLIANDSAPIHIAAAYDVPTVAVFGATSPELGFGPLATKSKVVSIDLPCRPCSAHGPQKCPLTHFRCMRDLGSEKVIEASLLLLADAN